MESLIQDAFLLVGIGGIVYSCYTLFMANISKSWVAVSGSIISHGITYSEDSEGDTIYEAKLQYEYEFRRRKHDGRRIAFGFSAWSFKWLVEGAYKDAVSRDPKITIYVNPKNPKMSTALCGIRNFNIANVVFFSVWTAVCYAA